jgi:hypothetical protein
MSSIRGLFYLDWLLDHRKEFQWLVMEKLGAEIAGKTEHGPSEKTTSML